MGVLKHRRLEEYCWSDAAACAAKSKTEKTAQTKHGTCMPDGVDYCWSATKEHYVVSESTLMMAPGLASQVRFGVAHLLHHHLTSCRHQSATGRPSGEG